MSDDSNLNFYDRFAQPYQLLYAQVDEDAAVARWVALLEELGLVQEPEARRLVPPALVDVGCGPGKHLAAWKRHGFAPTGLDGSPAMLAAAKRNLRSANVECSLILADILALDDAHRKGLLFSVAASHLFFPNLFSADLLGDLMDGIAKLLKPRGIWIADWRTDLPDSLPSEDIIPIEGVSWRRANLFDPSMGGFVQTWSTGETLLHERFWHHELTKIEAAASRAGLCILIRKRFPETPASLTLVLQKQLGTK